MERMQDETTGGGYGAVHTHLSASGADAGTSSSGGEGAADKVQELAGHAKERAQEVAGQAKERTQEVVGQAKERAQELGERAREKLSSSGVLGRIQENPLPALGIAFGLGFLLAGSDDSSSRRGGKAAKAKSQLKGAILGGLSAAVAQEFRSMVGLGGQGGGLLSALQGGGGGQNEQQSRGGGSGGQGAF